MPVRVYLLKQIPNEFERAAGRQDLSLDPEDANKRLL